MGIFFFFLLFFILSPQMPIMNMYYYFVVGLKPIHLFFNISNVISKCFFFLSKLDPLAAHFSASVMD